MIEHRGYTGVFEYDPELEILAGHVVDLQDQIYFEGTSVDELKESMRTVVDHYLEVCEKLGDDPEKPFSGQLRLRMDSDLHRNAAIAASTDGMSLNSWILQAVEASLTEAAEPRVR